MPLALERPAGLGSMIAGSRVGLCPGFWRMKGCSPISERPEEPGLRFVGPMWERQCSDASLAGWEELRLERPS